MPWVTTSPVSSLGSEETRVVRRGATPRTSKVGFARPGLSWRAVAHAGGGVGRGAVGEDRQVPPVVCIWTAGEALLAVEVGWGSS